MSIGEAGPGEGMRILVVDDDDLIQDIVAGICGRLGFREIVVAADGGQALSILDEDRDFRLVLSDWNMEPISGLELLETIRADERLDAAKFLMMTARTDAASVIAAKKAGVDGYILKPFGPLALAEKLAFALAPGRRRRY